MMIQRIAVSVLALSLFCRFPAAAQLFGPSDEDKAREAFQTNGVRELQDVTQQQDARIKGLEDKVQGLTQSLSQATGANEELNHQIQIQNDKIDKMQKDFAYRLCTLSAQQLGARRFHELRRRRHGVGRRSPGSRRSPFADAHARRSPAADRQHLWQRRFGHHRRQRKCRRWLHRAARGACGGKFPRSGPPPRHLGHPAGRSGRRRAGRPPTPRNMTRP